MRTRLCISRKLNDHRKPSDQESSLAEHTQRLPKSSFRGKDGYEAGLFQRRTLRRTVPHAFIARHDATPAPNGKRGDPVNVLCSSFVCRC